MNLKIFKDEKGFSLVEIMVAAGFLGVISLGASQMISRMMKGQATAEVKMEAIEIRRQIISNMSDKTACENTLVGTSLGESVTAIKNASNANLFSVGSKYGANALELQSINVVDVGDLGSGMRDAELRVVFKSLKKAAYGTSNKTFRSRLKVKATGPAAQITECFDDTSGVIATANETSCIALGGVWEPTTSTCTVSHFVRKDGDTMTGTLETPSLTNTGAIQTNSIDSTTTVTASTSVTSPQFCTGANCKAIGDLALANQACANGFVSDGVNPDGTVRCKALQCPANQFFAGLDSSGNSVCRPYPTNTCPTNEYVSEVKSDGTVVCLPVPNNATATCPAGQVLQSISAGTPTCVSNNNATCPVGQVLRSINAGVATCVADQNTNTNVFGKSCSAGEILRGFDSVGSPICDNLNQLTKNYLQTNCQLCVYYGDVWRQWDRAGCKNINSGLVGYNTVGDVDDNDIFYWEIKCN